jgi:hypothetical protein
MVFDNRRRFALGCIAVSILLGLALIQSSSQQGGGYNPWLDYNDDGIIDAHDLEALGKVYGSTGTPLNSPMTLEYDSGWIDIHDKQGQYFSMTPSFNLITSTWMPCIYGKVATGFPVHQKYWYGYNMPGWNGTYGGASQEFCYSLVQTGDGGYAIAGNTNSYGAGAYDSWLVKTDSAGNMQWSKTYGGTYNDYAYSVVQASDGGYAIASGTNSYGVGTPSSYNAYLVKTDAFGQMSLEFGVTITNVTADVLTFYRGKIDPYYNYIRVRIWVLKGNP